MVEVVVFDSESNGFLDVADTIHCIATSKIQDTTECLYKPDMIDEGLSRLLEADVLVCHNQIHHDIPLFLKIKGWKPKPSQKILDTLVFSRMLNPKREMPYGMKGSATHSIEAWARRFGMFKVENEDWSVYTDHMGVRCKSDVGINKLMLKELISEAGYSSEDVFFNAYAG